MFEGRVEPTSVVLSPLVGWPRVLEGIPEAFASSSDCTATFVLDVRRRGTDAEQGYDGDG